MAGVTDRLAILDKVINLVTSVKTWKQLFIKLIFIIILFIMVIVWYKWDDVFDFYKTSHTTLVVDKLEQTKKFNSASTEQLNVVHLSTGADFTAIFVFRPKNINYFVDIIAYEGRLPYEVDPKILGGYPIDKTSEEYNKHINGLYYISKDASPYLPTKEFVGVAYTFSCPYFNLDNYYSGSILMEWYTKKPVVTDTRLQVVCNQAARILGRIR